MQAGLAGLSQFTGAGIGVALIDSGVWTGHRSLAGRVVYSQRISLATATPGQRSVKTRTATARTSARPSRAARRIRRTRRLQTPFRGVAPGAQSHQPARHRRRRHGQGQHVMDAIDWAIRNRKRFNIRVINLSLGGAAEESYRDDPMCEAVERAVHAGIVVVAAAGNRGKDDEGRSVHGLIESPGIDPYVITVGAINTKGTARAVGRRADDV